MRESIAERDDRRDACRRVLKIAPFRGPVRPAALRFGEIFERRGIGGTSRHTAAVLLYMVPCVIMTGPPMVLAQNQESEVRAAASGDTVEEPALSVESDETEKSQGEEARLGGRKEQAVPVVVVTAQRKEEALREVPLSVSVLDNRFLAQQGITNVPEMFKYIPNFKLGAANSEVVSLNVRGFQSQDYVNNSFEPIVGLVIDGVSYGAHKYIQTGFLDLSRIEVLRGPQGTLFGKNATAGVVQFVTANPTDEFTGFVDLQVGELGYRRVEAAVGGPLIKDVVNFRIAALHDERDGSVKNTTAGFIREALKRFGDTEHRAARFKLDFPNVLGGDVLLTYEQFNSDIGATPTEFRRVPTANSRAFFRRYDPNADFKSGNFVGSMDFPESQRHNIQRFVANATYPVGEYTLNVIVGHSKLDKIQRVDADRSPAPIASNSADVGFAETIFEARLSSPVLPGLFGMDSLRGFGLSSTEFTAGFFFVRKAVTEKWRFDLNDAAFFEFVGAHGAPPGTFLSTPVDPNNRGEINESTTAFWDVENIDIAGYGQADWEFGPRWTLTGGLRVMTHRTNAEGRREIDPVAPIFRFGFGAQEFNVNPSRSDLQATPKVALRYDSSDAISYYASWAKGFRAGGFNTFSFDGQSLEYKPETTTAWEVGTKIDLQDQKLLLNLSLFWMTLKNFQLFTQAQSAETAGLPQIRVQNAGDARARGLEADLSWFPTSWLTVVNALGMNDSEYLDFPFGGCAPGFENTDGDSDPRCDQKGEPLQGAPFWANTLTQNVRVPLRTFGLPLPVALQGTDLTANFSTTYEDHQFVNEARHLSFRQSSFFLFDASVGVGNREQGWSFRLFGQNLSNENYADFIIAVLAGSTGTDQEFTHYVGTSRRIYGEFRWEF